MRSWIMLGLGLCGLLVTTAETGCYSEYSVRPACNNAVYIPAHRGPWGRWHPAHWRCR